MRNILLFGFYLLCGLAVLNAQSEPLRHSTLTEDAWLSCQTSPNPNSLRGTGHWISYDFGSVNALGNVDIWNYNNPDSLTNGIRTATIDYSIDGVAWTTLNDITFPMADGSSQYAGTKGVIPFAGRNARYVLITAKTNYGGTCYGLSELKFNLANSSLPVVITDIKSECQGGNLSVTWHSSSEEGVANYTLQSSIDGQSWQDLTSITATKSPSYSIETKSPQATYLRLMMKDQDGSVNYSKLFLNECRTASNNVVLSPNPFSSSVTTTFTNPSQYKSLRILNTLGQQVYTYVIPELNRWLLSLPPLANGTYYFEYSNGVDKQVVIGQKVE